MHWNARDYIYSKKSLLASARRRHQNLLPAFLIVSIFKLVNFIVYLASVDFWCCTEFYLSLAQLHPHIIIKGVSIREVNWPDFKSNVVFEIFTHPRLRCPVYVVQRSVLFPGIVFKEPSSWSKADIPPLRSASVLSLRPYRDLNGGITLSSLVTTPNMMGTGHWDIISDGTSWKDWASQQFLYELPCRIISHMRKNKACLVGRVDWVCSKALQLCLYSYLPWLVIKIGFFASCMKNRECIHALPAW